MSTNQYKRQVGVLQGQRQLYYQLEAGKWDNCVWPVVEGRELDSPIGINPRLDNFAHDLHIHICCHLQPSLEVVGWNPLYIWCNDAQNHYRSWVFVPHHSNGFWNLGLGTTALALSLLKDGELSKTVYQTKTFHCLTYIKRAWYYTLCLYTLIYTSHKPIVPGKKQPLEDKH